MIIRNRHELLSHGNIDQRKLVLDVMEAGLKAADPYPHIKRIVKLENKKLLVGSKVSGSPTNMPDITLPIEFDLSMVDSIYVLGGGKAVQRMAQAVEDILGDLITEGHVNAKKGEIRKCRRIDVTFGGHPIPDEDCVEGATKSHEIERKAKRGDIVFYFTTGGGSALNTWPAPGLTLEDIQEVTKMLYFESGASMPETNRVRGKLRMPRTGETSEATMIHLVSSETPPAYGPLGFHRRFPSNDAIEILKRYGLWGKIPERVRNHLEKVHDDPRFDAYLQPAHSLLLWKTRYQFRVTGPEYMLEAARSRAEQQGVKAHILASSLNDIEVGPIAETLANIASETENLSRPFKPPCIMIVGGEPTVATGEVAGVGGRNQEFALSAAPWIDGSRNIVVASVDSDGADGPTDAAGGIVDGYTMTRAKASSVDVFTELLKHNSYGALTKLGDAIFTGVQGQNLRSLALVYVGGPKQLIPAKATSPQNTQ